MSELKFKISRVLSR